MFLVFLRSDGSYYKALTAKSSGDSHIPHVLDDLRDTLPDDGSPMTWTEVKAAMNAKNPEKPQRLFPAVVTALLLGASLLLSGTSNAQTSDGVSPSALNGTLGFGYVYNGSSWDRLRGTTGGFTLNQFPAASALGDATANPTTTNIGSNNFLFNGTTWDRQRSTAGTVGIPNVNTEGTKASYSASSRFGLGGATANEVCFLAGSASKTVKISKIEFNGFSTAATITQYALSKRSTANSGGTCSTPTVVPHDSANAAASAVFSSCTDSSGQTPGTLVGNVDITTFVTDSASSASQQPKVYTFGTENTQSIVLRGTAQSLNVSLTGSSFAAGAFLACRFQWTEE